MAWYAFAVRFEAKLQDGRVVAKSPDAGVEFTVEKGVSLLPPTV